jgi:transcriptional regulator with XRE-family HTH domain
MVTIHADFVAVKCSAAAGMEATGMTFAMKLKELRTKAKMTRKQLALASGLALNTIRDYEQGRREPTLESAFKLARGLNVDLSAFQDPASGSRPARTAKKRKQ